MELLLQHMYLILHCSHLHLLQRTCDGGGWSKVKGCISCVVLPALVQANHLGLEDREGVKGQRTRRVGMICTSNTGEGAKSNE